MTEPRRIILVDSSGFLHRFFHGYPPRQGSVDGQSVEAAALFGYTKYINTLAQELEYEGLVHVLDNDQGSVFRKELYPEYKGTRQEKAPELVRQEALLGPLLNALGQRALQAEGVEADDLIYSLAKKLASQGDEVMVITSDKDLMQLVEDGSIVLASYKDMGPGMRKEHVFIESAQVIEKIGVRPDQVADYLALVGDSVDNIPGVFKVGPKTAAGWLNEYGSLANLMTHAADIKGAAGQRLRDALPLLPTYRRLTGCLDVDVAIPAPGKKDLDWARKLIGWPNNMLDSSLPEDPAPLAEDQATAGSKFARRGP